MAAPEAQASEAARALAVDLVLVRAQAPDPAADLAAGRASGVARDQARERAGEVATEPVQVADLEPVLERARAMRPVLAVEQGKAAVALLQAVPEQFLSSKKKICKACYACSFSSAKPSRRRRRNWIKLPGRRNSPRSRRTLR